MEYIYAFLTGGAICTIGQILLDTTKLTMPRILVLFVVTGVILQALNLYETLVDIGHQGATLPLTGFGYSLAKGAMDGAEKGFIEAITGPLKETSAGIGIAVSAGYIIAMIFNPKSPK